MKTHPSIPATVCLFLLCVSSCKDGEKTVSEAPDSKPVPEAQAPVEKVAPPKTQEEKSAPSSAVPSVAVGKSTGDQKILAGKSYYNDENLAEARGLINKMSAEVKEQILTEMKAKRKVSAVKITREQAKTSLAVSKLTVELIAIEAGVSAGF